MIANWYRYKHHIRVLQAQGVNRYVHTALSNETKHNILIFLRIYIYESEIVTFFDLCATREQSVKNGILIVLFGLLAFFCASPKARILHFIRTEMRGMQISAQRG